MPEAPMPEMQPPAPLVLPRGITGFFTLGESVPWVDLQELKRTGYAAARALGGTVRGLEPAEAGPIRNFHVLRLRLGAREAGGTEMTVLCNAHHPWLAVVAAGEVFTPFTFRDMPAVARAPGLWENFRVLTSQELEAAPEAAMLAKLSSAETMQLRYWRPKRLGDIIFNLWD